MTIDHPAERAAAGLTPLERLSPLEVHTSEVLVVGSGAAGLTVALGCAPRRTAVLSAGEPARDGSSAWAQGGVAAALGGGDAPALHAADTVAAGAGLVEEEMARLLTAGAREGIGELLRLGARFDREPDGRLALGREGAHGRRRIVHARGDATGAEIMRALGRAAVRAAGEGGHLEIFAGTTALELVLSPRPASTGGGFRVAGVLALRSDDQSPGGRLIFHRAPAVVLATGGLGGVFLHTTNPEGVRGDGLALAARSGARLMDLELVQFHPTALDVGALDGSTPAAGTLDVGLPSDGARLPLLTEALRGEGAVLVDETGHRFVAEAHPLAELAPRDVVARAIHRHRAAGHRTYLDAREAVGQAFPERFPTVFEACRRHGLDPRREPMPVIPAAHYHMGGVATDGRGRTSLAGLWACGEVAASGLHGANRLASNSLLEALVFGRRVADDLRHRPDSRGRAGEPLLTPLSESFARGGLGPGTEVHARVRRLMSERVGLVRSAGGLGAALGEIGELSAGQLSEGRGGSQADRNLLLVARLLATAALARRESRGGHHREDFPESDPAWRCHLTLQAPPSAEARAFCVGRREVTTEPGATEPEAADRWAAASATLRRGPLPDPRPGLATAGAAPQALEGF